MAKRITIRRGLRLRKYYARQCHVEAQAWLWRFTQIIEQIFGKKLYFTPSEADQLRLMNLRAWAIKYHVSEEFVVKTLVEYWSKRAKKWEEQDGRRKRFHKDENSIGCKIPTLTGRVSEEILKQAATSEQVISDKLVRQERDVQVYEEMHLLVTDDRIKEVDSPKDLVKHYRRMVNQDRRTYDRVKTILSRRRYPNSPWY